MPHTRYQRSAGAMTEIWIWARSHLSLIRIAVVLTTAPAVFRISMTPLSLLFLDVRMMAFARLVGRSLTVAVPPGGTFVTPAANLMRLVAFIAAASFPRTFRALTKRVTRRPAHGAPSVQVSRTAHEERLQLPCGEGRTAT